MVKEEGAIRISVRELGALEEEISAQTADDLCRAKQFRQDIQCISDCFTVRGIRLAAIHRCIRLWQNL